MFEWRFNQPFIDNDNSDDYNAIVDPAPHPDNHFLDDNNYEDNDYINEPMNRMALEPLRKLNMTRQDAGNVPDLAVVPDNTEYDNSSDKEDEDEDEDEDDPPDEGSSFDTDDASEPRSETRQ